MASADRKRTIKPKDSVPVEAPVLKRQKKAPVRPDMLDPTFRAKPRASNGEKAKQGASQPGRRKAPASGGAESPTNEANGPTTQTSANHNKYCHFCQHVKVRASSMLACENQECCRRFCEHCLMTHLNEDVDPMSSDAWEMVNGKPVWYCPICRNKCCCSVSDCTDDHRHCKAYRYRRRRAELASKRMAAVADKRGGKKTIKVKAPIRPTLELTTKNSDSDSTESPTTWPASASSTVSQWSAAETEVGDAHSHSSEDEVVEKVATQDSLASAVWTAEPRAAAPSTASEVFVREQAVKEVSDFCSIWDTGDQDDEVVEEAEDDPEDSFRGMYGMMCAGTGDLEEEGFNCMSSEVDVDETQWLRRTYETVYNPVARQRALNALVSGIGAGKRQEGMESMEQLATFSAPAQPARKCTVMYDFV
mmetsp:Transcript_74685/g.112542  ORF Transcript_74685/g.112542 Transcript_74685/m.112542 type:complete len:420 (+) Transcript_74685:145-1404(+)